MNYNPFYLGHTAIYYEYFEVYVEPFVSCSGDHVLHSEQDREGMLWPGCAAPSKAAAELCCSSKIPAPPISGHHRRGFAGKTVQKYKQRISKDLELHLFKETLNGHRSIAHLRDS